MCAKGLVLAELRPLNHNLRVFLANFRFRPNPEVQRFTLNVLKALYKQTFFFSPQGLGLARKTVENFLARATRLYEQEREEPESPSVLGLYV